MKFYKQIKYLIIIIFLFSIVPLSSTGQSKNIRSIIAKVIALDSNIFNKKFSLQINAQPRQFYYALYHLRVLDTIGDTLLLAYVFDTKQVELALTNFGIKKDSIYQFALFNLNPCNCDFPLIMGCLYRKKQSQSVYKPLDSSIAIKPYRSIYRILDHVPINHELWNELRQ